MINICWQHGAFLGLVALLAGPGCDQPSTGPAAGGGAAAPEGKHYLLAAEPAGALEVRAARADAADQATVVVVGRIGGSVDPWVAEAAAFTIVDRALTPCSERPDDTCPTPWDYCCDRNELPAATVTVQVVDQGGQLVAVDARKLLGVEPLQTVVVRGRAQRDTAGNLTVLADGLFVRPSAAARATP
jgi:hypothetical protein